MNLDELEAAARAATPGKWALVRHTSGLDGRYTDSDDWTIKGPKGNIICIEGNHINGPLVGDPDFIAAANPSSILSLIARMRKLEAVAEAAPSVIEAMAEVQEIARKWEPDHSSGRDRQWLVRGRDTAAALREAIEELDKP